MKATIIVAVIAAFPPTLAAVLGFLSNRRSIRRTVGEPVGVPLVDIVVRLESKIDRVLEAQADARERLARLESDTHRHAYGGSR